MDKWVTDNKGAGAWDFEQQKDKPHYNEGNLISNWDNPIWAFEKQKGKYAYNDGDILTTKDNPVWPMGSRAGLPAAQAEKHIPCGYWFDSPKSQTYVPVGYCRIPTLTEVGVLTLNTGEDNPRSINIYDGYLYVDCYTNPKKIVKIRLSNFQRVGVLTLSINSYDTCNAVIVNGFYYTGGRVGTSGINFRLCKIDLSSFTEVGSISAPYSDSFQNITAAVNDDKYIYYGGSILPSNPAWFYALDLTSFTFGTAKTTTQNYGTYAQSGAINVGKNAERIDINTIVWAVDTGTSNAIVRKFTVLPFAQTYYTTLQAGGGQLQSSAISSDGIWGYFAGTSSAIRKVALVETMFEDILVPAMTQVAVLYPDTSYVMGMVIDEANQKLYTIDANTPARLVRINLDYFYIDLFFNLTQAGITKPSLALDTANQILYVGHYASPAKITKISICGD